MIKHSSRWCVRCEGHRWLFSFVFLFFVFFLLRQHLPDELLHQPNPTGRRKRKQPKKQNKTEMCFKFLPVFYARSVWVTDVPKQDSSPLRKKTLNIFLSVATWRCGKTRLAAGAAQVNCDLLLSFPLSEWKYLLLKKRPWIT